MASDKLFVVAIDFGTTYSGYAFSTIGNRSNILTYNWSTDITQTPKTPTSILFTPSKDFHSFGYDAEEMYATLSQSRKNKDWFFFKRFKLTLYKNENLNERTTIRDFTGRTMPAIDVFSAGIKFLKDHLFNHFQDRIGYMYMRNSDIHWVLTVPAIWDETAKKFMRKAAEMAGIPAHQLTLALEPEAAALYSQMGEKVTGLRPLEPGQKFLLLDCGGGTIDVTVHEVRRDKSLKEIHRASGGIWGGIKVDDAFHTFLLEQFNYKVIESLSKSDNLNLDKSFESLKKKADTESLKEKADIDTKTYTMTIPLLLCQNASPSMLREGRLKIESRVLNGFFKGPVTNICHHVSEILKELRSQYVSTIVLVGGFAESKLLQNELKDRFPTRRILIPANPSTAVVSGAVEFGHSPEKVRFRMSPMTYGVQIMVPFENGFHPNNKSCVIEGKQYCKDIFCIHVEKDQSVETGTSISNKTYEPTSSTQTSSLIRVFETESKSPTYVTEVGCRAIGSFEVDIPPLGMHQDRSVNVKMIFSGTELKVEAKNATTEQIYTATFKFER